MSAIGWSMRNGARCNFRTTVRHYRNSQPKRVRKKGLKSRQNRRIERVQRM
jgi:hypothetical protein